MLGELASVAHAAIVDLHRHGWLAPIHFHLASLERFSDLLARQGAREPHSFTDQSEGVLA